MGTRTYVPPVSFVAVLSAVLLVAGASVANVAVFWDNDNYLNVGTTNTPGAPADYLPSGGQYAVLLWTSVSNRWAPEVQEMRASDPIGASYNSGTVWLLASTQTTATSWGSFVARRSKIFSNAHVGGNDIHAGYLYSILFSDTQLSCLTWYILSQMSYANVVYNPLDLTSIYGINASGPVMPNQLQSYTTNMNFIPVPVVPVGTGSSGNPYLITQLEHLVWMGTTVGSSSGRYYRLMNDIDVSLTVGCNNGLGFAPIGSEPPASPFEGVFDGGGHTLTGLSIDRPSEDNVGLFGFIGANGVVNGVGLEGGSIQGSNAVGSLAGGNAGTVTNCYGAASVSGDGDDAGGLVGVNYGTVDQCSATGRVTGAGTAGGLIGLNNAGAVSECYAAGPVAGAGTAGGLVGSNASGGTITTSYWDTQASGQAASGGGTGKTTVQMRQRATFVGWDFVAVWGIQPGVSYPRFLWQPNSVAWQSDGIAAVRGTSPLLTWYCDQNGDRVSDRTFQYAVPGDRPIVGDMNGDGDDDIAITRDYAGMLVWHADLDGNGTTDRIFAYGVAGDRSVSGDVNGDGQDDIVITRDYNGMLVWHCDLDGNGTTDQIFAYGVAGDHAALGDINGDGIDDIAITRDFGGVLAWHCDLDRNGTTDTIFSFGNAGDWGVIGALDQARP